MTATLWIFFFTFFMLLYNKMKISRGFRNFLSAVSDAF